MNKWILVLMVFTYFYGTSQSDSPYQTPHADILSLADATPAPILRMTSDAKRGIMLYRHSYKSIEELAAPEMKLAGLRINPFTNGPSRSTYFHNVRYLDIEENLEFDIQGLPSNAKLSNFSWSADQSKIAFTNTVDQGVELWVLTMASKKATRLTPPIINANIGNVMEWVSGGNEILITTLLKDRKPLTDTKSSIPSGPTISENDGQKAQNRTYQDLLKNTYDEQNFEILSTSEICKVNMKGEISPFLPAAMYSGFEFSPKGDYLMTYELKRPFSYIVTYSRFPSDVNIYEGSGKLVKNFLKIPLTEELPKGFMAVRKGPRSIRWRADKPATLYWAEALDEGDPAIEVAERDAVYEVSAPFTAEPRLLAKTKERYAGIQWANDEIAILHESWWNTRNARMLIFNPSDITVLPRLFNERNAQDIYADIGDFSVVKNQYDNYVVEVSGDEVHMIGEGFTQEGKFPFVDKYKLSDFSKQRIYLNNDTGHLENLSMAIDTKEGVYLTRLESKNQYPNYYLRNIKDNSLRQITHNTNPFKVLEGAEKEIIKYTRPDGVELSATLYLPVGYDKQKKEKMPMIMWAYPTEFKDKASAGQVSSNANEFTFPYYGSPIYWLTRGYVVLDDASFPIVGEGTNEPNDTFIPQLVANAKAAIDAVDSLGYIDRSKVAVGGHSYGAFMTANLLTHSDLFAAGIARSGAYNRTLTPFGFQSEERSYWEAPDVYDAMSPFQNADKMKSPLLLVHGEDDNNSGTYPMQSERYFNALKGLGATVRLVLLPKESHGYAARESILHLLWEQDQWLERYVKNKPLKP